jgi:3-isopropylmalate dehydrogenase
MSSTKTCHIAVLPGDGIGPEVTAEALKVLRAAETALGGFHLDFQEFSAGAAEYLRSGDPLPAETIEEVKKYDAILLGAMGLPNVRWPSGLEMVPQIDLRERLDLYCGVRPIYLYHESHCPLKGMGAGQIDFVIIRESTEGLFSARGHAPPPGAQQAEDRMLVTRRGAERLFRAAFLQARRRRGRLALIDKANVLPSMAYFRRVFDEVAAEFPDVQTERIYVDAAALFLLQRPQSFDVLVTENMFGDILSDLAAGLVGGMGMAPSADIGDRWAVFQPSHGSAPDIAGQGVANPVAAILSAAMMLEWLGGEALERAAGSIRAAARFVLSDPRHATRDLGGTLSTAQMGDLIASAFTEEVR